MLRYLHYLVVPVFYVVVALIGSSFTAQGVSTWYVAIAKPGYTPPGTLIGVVWTTINILTAFSFILFINRSRSYQLFWMVVGLYLFNGIINALWSYIFFTRHMMGLAIVDSAAIWASVAALMIFARQTSLLSSLLLLPYIVWVSFATYLTYIIYRLN